jgi:hypothetical protein
MVFLQALFTIDVIIGKLYGNTEKPEIVYLNFNRDKIGRPLLPDQDTLLSYNLFYKNEIFN